MKPESSSFGKIRLVFNTFVLYGLTFAVSIAAAFRHVIMPQIGSVSPLEPTLANVAIFAAVFLGFTIVMVRFARGASALLRIFLVLALIFGAQFIFAGWLTWWQSVAGAFLIVLLLRFAPVVLVHDVAIGLGIGGVAAMMGLSITPLTAAALLALLSIYDIVSVYRTKHMVALAGRMLESGAVFGFLVPSRLSGFLVHTRDALEQRQVMMLGSGDIGLPLVLATSVVSTSIGAAVMVSAFSLAGLLLMHWLFLNQDEPMPMAALPPIAMSAVLGYVVAVLLGI